MENRLNMFFGTDGKPFMTKNANAPDYKNDYPFYKQPQPIRFTSVDILDLSNKDDFAFYLKIWRAAGYGSVRVVQEELKWIEAKENWKVFIRWFICGKMDPSELRAEQATAAKALKTRLLVGEDNVQ